MEASNNKLTISFTDQPELQELFSRKKVGEACQFEFKGTIDEITEEGAVISMDELETDESKAADVEEGVAVPASGVDEEVSESPAMLVMGKNAKSKPVKV